MLSHILWASEDIGDYEMTPAEYRAVLDERVKNRQAEVQAAYMISALVKGLSR